MSKKFTVTLEDEEHRVIMGLCERDTLTQKKLLMRSVRAYQKETGKPKPAVTGTVDHGSNSSNVG
jgi:hypothetical protein